VIEFPQGKATPCSPNLALEIPAARFAGAATAIRAEDRPWHRAQKRAANRMSVQRGTRLFCRNRNTEPSVEERVASATIAQILPQEH
jgi:hypothetical protein